MLLKRLPHVIPEKLFQGNWFILSDDIRETVWVKVKGNKKHVIRRYWEEDMDYSSIEVWISYDTTDSGWGIMEENKPVYIKEY